MRWAKTEGEDWWEIEVVAREGIAQHYNRVSVPTDGVVLYPRRKEAA